MNTLSSRKGEYRSAQREGEPVRTLGRFQALILRRATLGALQ
jgi:hypothetical protein